MKMSNGHLVRYLAQEKGISVEEAQKVCEERKNFNKFFKEVNEDEYQRERIDSRTRRPD